MITSSSTTSVPAKRREPVSAAWGIPNAEAYPKKVLLDDGTVVILRPLQPEDKVPLLRLFERIPESERYYLKENVTAPEVIRSWTDSIDHHRVIPIVAVVDREVVADATLHRSRVMARRHVGEVRVVVDPAYRMRGLGKRLIRELLDLAASLGLEKATFEGVGQREEAALMAATSVGFSAIAVLKNRIKDIWGNNQDLVLMEIPLHDSRLWWQG